MDTNNEKNSMDTNNEKKLIKKYSIGIDIGSTSVGWSVIDENYNLMKRKGRHLWGSRLFDIANTAGGRRINRSVRRRYNKRRERVRLLKMMMNDMIMDVDDSFYIRLEHTTFLNKEDKKKILNKQYKSHYNLFVDKDFNDKTFHKKYPTIYHLRKELCESKEKADPRLIYLALHHIVKYRGNFLYEGETFSLDNSNILEKFHSVFRQLFEFNEVEYAIGDSVIEDVMNELKSNKKKRIIIDNVLNLFSLDKDIKKRFKVLIESILGYKFKIQNMLPYIESLDSLQFSDDSFDTKIEENASALGSYIEFIDEMQSLYSWIKLSQIVSDDTQDTISISNTMVKRYEKHRKDLEELKALIKEQCPDKYFDLFKNTDKKVKNYVNYIHHNLLTKKDELYKTILMILKDLPENPVIQNIKEDIEKENYLLKQNDISNASVPYQLQRDEMEKILNNQKIYYPSLEENYAKFISILTFRIPYYYGPLDGNKEFGWLVKNEGKENERILPWNHDKVVNADETSMRFIEKMTNYCTYFPMEKVLPKYSLLISKYELLNELNKIRINEKFIAVDLKAKLIDTLFMSRKDVSEKALKQWLYKYGGYRTEEKIVITGYQKDLKFSSSLTPWIDFTKIFKKIDDTNFNKIEDIIYHLTIFTEEKIMKRWLMNYHSDLTKEQVTQVLKLHYTGWSRISKKLVLDIKCPFKGNSQASLLDVLEQSNFNLMEIINDKTLRFKKKIDDANAKEVTGNFSYDEVKELAGSPSIKKGIWQALLVIDEIKKVMKCEPENIFIEFARSVNEKKRTESVVKRLQDIYKIIEKEVSVDKKLKDSLFKEDKSKAIKSDRLYLYYLQMGKCMYTGTPLDLDKLEQYDIDHIVPRSLIKDDSFDNKVLVKKLENLRKSNDEVVPFAIRDRMSSIWKQLYDHKLMSPKKYFALTRPQLTEKDIERFVNRQLVETRQIIKNVAQIVNNHYALTKVVAIRAELSHNFRVKYDIVKNRDINDFHHAHDAYVASILGSYILKRFPKLENQFVYGEYKKYLSKDRKDKEISINTDGKDGFVLNSMNNMSIVEETGEVIWDENTLTKVLKPFGYYDYFVTKKLEKFDGSFFGATILPNNKNSSKSKTEASIGVNKQRSDVSLYGGFTQVSYYPIAVEGIKGKKKTRRLVKMPLIYRDNSIENKIEYISKTEKLSDITFISEDIKKNQLIEINGAKYYLTSPTEVVNAVQLILTKDEINRVSEIELSIKKDDYSFLNNNDLVILFECLLNKIRTFYPKYQGLLEKLMNQNTSFSKLTIQEKCIVIKQLIITLSAGAQNGKININNFKIGDRMGRLSSQTIDLDKTYFINESVTGIYRKKYKL